MMSLGVCAKGLTIPVIFENETMNAEIYINEVLPIALECGDKMLGSNRTYRQDGARPHTGCNKIIAPCTLYKKNGIFCFCNRSNR